MSVVRSTDDSETVLRIRTGAMVALLLFGMLLCFGVVYAGMLYGFMNFTTCVYAACFFGQSSSEEDDQQRKAFRRS